MGREYTEKELDIIVEMSKHEAYISKEEAIAISLHNAKMRSPYPNCEVDFDYEKLDEVELVFEARYKVSFTLNYRTYSCVIQATSGKIISSSVTVDYKGNFFKDGVAYLKYADENNFTSNFGMNIRKHTYKYLKKPLLQATDGNIVLESITNYGEASKVDIEKDLSFLNLKSSKPYIFVSTHSFCEDVNSALAVMDRNAYLLFGSTEQLENSKQVYGLWAMGMVYVGRMDPWSRENSILKMKRLIDNGISVIICAEGGYNNTENKIVEELFEGAVQLHRRTFAPIVPMASFREYGSKNIYITADAPLHFLNVTATEGTERLRNVLATLEYELWIHHASWLKRKSLPSNCRFQFMEERKYEYMKSHWLHDVWEEELTNRKNGKRPSPQDIRATFDSVQITRDNYLAINPIRKQREEDLLYDFKRYMHNTWNISYEEAYEKFIKPYIDNDLEETKLELVLETNK